MSDWGLFSRCETRVVNQDGTYRQFTYSVAGHEVSFLKPVEGVGTNLMHGDFARKLSPSEEALTTWLLKNLRLFHGKRVLVLGTGLGLAPLTCGACSRATCVDMTDGDPEVLRTLRATLALNEGRFGATCMSVQELFWSENGKPPQEPYDIIIAADVVYLEEFHQALLSTACRHLLVGGLFVLLCSKRNGSLDKFANAARHWFPRISIHDDYDEDVSKAIRRSAKCFPIMVKLSSLPLACDTPVPESVTRCIAEQKERQQQQRQVEENMLQQMARQQSLQNARTKRMVRKREKRLRQLAAAAAAAAEAASLEAPTKEEEAPRKPTLSRPEQENRSDWNLFARHCRAVEGHDHKEMVYDCAGKDIVIRKPLVGDFFHGDFARKISPSEEALATYIIKHKRVFKKKRVLVLGAGLGLASFVLGAWTAAKHVEITDGDEHVVECLKENLALNADVMSAKKVVTRRLFWGEGLDSIKRFDVIVAADVVYLEDLHPVLLHTLRKLLKPTGTALIFASPRNGSLEAFRLAAAGVFDRVRAEKDRDKDVEKALHGFKCYPRIVRMHWTHEKASGTTSKVEAASMVPHASSKSRKPSVSDRSLGPTPPPAPPSSTAPPAPPPSTLPAPTTPATSESHSQALGHCTVSSSSSPLPTETTLPGAATKRTPSQSRRPPSRSSSCCSSPGSAASNPGWGARSSGNSRPGFGESEGEGDGEEASCEESDSLIGDDFDDELANESDLEKAPLMYSPDVDDEDDDLLGQSEEDDDDEDDEGKTKDEFGGEVHSLDDRIHGRTLELDIPIHPERDLQPHGRTPATATSAVPMEVVSAESGRHRRAGSSLGEASRTFGASKAADGKARPPLPSPALPLPIPTSKLSTPSPPPLSTPSPTTRSVAQAAAAAEATSTAPGRAAPPAPQKLPLPPPPAAAGKHPARSSSRTSCSSSASTCYPSNSGSGSCACCCSGARSGSSIGLCSGSCSVSGGISQSSSTTSLAGGLPRSSSRAMSVGKLIAASSRTSMSTATSTPSSDRGRGSPLDFSSYLQPSTQSGCQHPRQTSECPLPQQLLRQEQQHHHHIHSHSHPHPNSQHDNVPHLPPLLPRSSCKQGHSPSSAQTQSAMTAAASAPAAPAAARRVAAAPANESTNSYPRHSPPALATKTNGKADFSMVSLELVGSAALAPIVGGSKKKAAPAGPKVTRSRSNSVQAEARNAAISPELVPGWYCRSLSAEPPSCRAFLSAVA